MRIVAKHPPYERVLELEATADRALGWNQWIQLGLPQKDHEIDNSFDVGIDYGTQ